MNILTIYSDPSDEHLTEDQALFEPLRVNTARNLAVLRDAVARIEALDPTPPLEHAIWDAIDALPPEMHANLQLDGWPAGGAWAAKLTLRFIRPGQGEPSLHQFAAASDTRAGALRAIWLRAAPALALYARQKEHQS